MTEIPDDASMLEQAAYFWSVDDQVLKIDTEIVDGGARLTVTVDLRHGSEAMMRAVALGESIENLIVLIAEEIADNGEIQ